MATTPVPTTIGHLIDRVRKSQSNLDAHRDAMAQVAAQAKAAAMTTATVQAQP